MLGFDHTEEDPPRANRSVKRGIPEGRPGELVRKTVEDTLNGLLEEEADNLVGAERYERTVEREAYLAGHYDRKLTTSSGEVMLRMPKLKGMRFATAIVERYRRRETSVEETIIEMYPAGVSTRRIEDVSEILWGSSARLDACSTSACAPATADHASSAALKPITALSPTSRSVSPKPPRLSPIGTAHVP